MNKDVSNISTHPQTTHRIPQSQARCLFLHAGKKEAAPRLEQTRSGRGLSIRFAKAFHPAFRKLGLLHFLERDIGDSAVGLASGWGFHAIEQTGSRKGSGD